MTVVDRIWRGIIKPEKPDLEPEVAKYFLSFKLTAKEVRRRKLLASARSSALTEDQLSELGTLRQAHTMFRHLQTKCRRSLRAGTARGSRRKRAKRR